MVSVSTRASTRFVSIKHALRDMTLKKGKALREVSTHIPSASSAASCMLRVRTERQRLSLELVNAACRQTTGAYRCSQTMIATSSPVWGESSTETCCDHAMPTGDARERCVTVATLTVLLSRRAQGGLHIESGTAILTDCDFTANSASVCARSLCRRARLRVLCQSNMH